ncbi:MAG: hypothetical protein AUG51_01600 [Acidobacteria bacterium 13_1_20CM_3_53_8]|nr:MAG: hypothetical protein AUG51_01600 [Acidobacteria bacterium 13_1_20CM_3_53_8]
MGDQGDAAKEKEMLRTNSSFISASPRLRVSSFSLAFHREGFLCLRQLRNARTRVVAAQRRPLAAIAASFVRTL